MAITSADPTRLLVSTDPTATGTGSIVIEAVAGSRRVPTFYMQALDDSGTVEMTASAPAFATTTSTITLTPSGIAFRTGNFTSTTLSANSNVQLESLQLNPTTLNRTVRQSVRGGITVEIEVESSVPGVGTIVTPVVFSGVTIKHTTRGGHDHESSGVQR